MQGLKNNRVFIVGHRHPDTDSIVSALAYANLKRELGQDAVACRLGPINDETDYVLKRFNVEKPILLKDARATLVEIEMDRARTIPLNASIKDAMDLMAEDRRPLAVVDDYGRLLGMVTNSNLSYVAMGDTSHTVALLKKTPVDNIANAISGELVYRPENFRFNGKTSIVAIAKTRLENYEVKDRLVIVGNDTESQKAAIEKGAAAVVLVWTDEISDEVLNLAKEHDCAIIRSSHGSMNTSRYLLFSPNVREVMTTELITFNQNEFVDEVGKEMLKSRFRSYPVMDDQNRVIGFVSRYHILNSQSKKIILVDHNEASQSVEGIEQAEVLEIIDHHRIGDLSTTKPIYFRNEIIGSTASIITKMYLENEVEISSTMASLLLSALLSDTLNLRSPTTSQEDFKIAKILEERSGLDRFEYAREMFSSTSNLKNKSYQEIINQDIKRFNISDQKVMVSQVLVYHFGELDNILDDFQDEMDQFVKDYELDLLVLVFTSIVDNGSIIMASGELKQAVHDAFPTDEDEILENVVSRKNQIIPQLSRAINEYLR